MPEPTADDKKYLDEAIKEVRAAADCGVAGGRRFGLPCKLPDLGAAPSTLVHRTRPVADSLAAGAQGNVRGRHPRRRRAGGGWQDRGTVRALRHSAGSLGSLAARWLTEMRALRGPL